MRARCFADAIAGDAPLVVETGDVFCKSQESKLALLWTVGIFALNCGPVIMGFVLDYLGPKFTGILGRPPARLPRCSFAPLLFLCSLGQHLHAAHQGASRPIQASTKYIYTRRRALPPSPGVVLNMLGLVLFGVSSSTGTDAFIPAAVILGLGNITFHLAQFHISALFPRKRGLVSAVFVAGFTGSGIIMYLLLLIFQAAGSTT